MLQVSNVLLLIHLLKIHAMNLIVELQCLLLYCHHAYGTTIIFSSELDKTPLRINSTGKKLRRLTF